MVCVTDPYGRILVFLDRLILKQGAINDLPIITLLVILSYINTELQSSEMFV
jgi:hypothetical protein